MLLTAFLWVMVFCGGRTPTTRLKHSALHHPRRHDTSRPACVASPCRWWCGQPVALRSRQAGPLAPPCPANTGSRHRRAPGLGPEPHGCCSGPCSSHKGHVHRCMLISGGRHIVLKGWGHIQGRTQGGSRVELPTGHAAAYRPIIAACGHPLLPTTVPSRPDSTPALPSPASGEPTHPSAHTSRCPLTRSAVSSVMVMQSERLVSTPTTSAL
jgi:hypothetical protein